MSERKPGWYWVNFNGQWAALEYVITPRLEFFKWGDRPLGTQPNITDVGSRIPTPDEPWQCVPKYEPTEAMLFKAEVEAKSKEVDMGSPWPTEHPDDGGGVAGAYYRGLLAAAPSPDES